MGVDCPSVTTCVAVGDGDNAAIIRGSGAGWNSLALPSYAHLVGDSSLNGVTCVRGWCLAVGEFLDPHKATHGLAATIVGTHVRFLSMPQGLAIDDLNSVSCAAVGRCIAVGAEKSGSRQAGLILSLHGSRWTPIPFADASRPANVDLKSASCSSPTLCLAVGESNAYGANHLPVAVIRTGSAWRQVVAPLPRHILSASFLGLSCVPGSCTAVGDIEDAYSDAPLVDRFDGAHWTRVSLPGAFAGDFVYSVACTGPASCVAAGTFPTGCNNGNNQYPLVIRWSDGRWSREVVPWNPGTFCGETALYAISCPAAATCTAVGQQWGQPTFDVVEYQRQRRWIEVTP